MTDTNTRDNMMNNNHSTEYDDVTRDELIRRIESLEDQLEEADGGYSRRSVLSAAAALASVGAMGVYATGRGTAAPSGTFPKSGDDPLLKIRADRVRLVARSSDPSSPDDGSMWYRGDL